jgi:MFS family permease
MPWKIVNLDYSSERPHLHMKDPAQPIHLRAYLAEELVEIALGADDPEDCSVRATVSPDAVNVVGTRFEPLHVKILSSILGSLDVEPHERDTALAWMNEKIARRAGTFRSLRGFNYRVWAGGAIVSNVGTWMQRTAQDWLVLTQLTHNNATAVGVVMALQFGPQVLLLPLTGFAADHLDRRKLLIATQAAMGALALGWAAHRHRARPAVARVRVRVSARLRHRVRLAGAPDLRLRTGRGGRPVERGGAELHVVQRRADDRPGHRRRADRRRGTGWVFLINAASFAAVLCSLSLLRVGELHLKQAGVRDAGSLVEGLSLRLEAARPESHPLLMLFLIGTFGLNFPIFISTMSVTVFHAGAGQYGLLTSIMAIGTVAGALLAAGGEKPRIALLSWFGAAVFGLGWRWPRSCPTTGSSARRSSSSACRRRPSPRRPTACAALDRARDARARDGDPARHRARRHADRRADRRLGRRHLRPALGARPEALPR